MPDPTLPQDPRQLLETARELLEIEPQPGEVMHAVLQRIVQAQRMIALANLAIVELDRMYPARLVASLATEPEGDVTARYTVNVPGYKLPPPDPDDDAATLHAELVTELMKLLPGPTPVGPVAQQRLAREIIDERTAFARDVARLIGENDRLRKSLHDQATLYPHASGDHTVLGPEIFTNHPVPSIGSVICWKGVDFIPAPENVSEVARAGERANALSGRATRQRAANAGFVMPVDRREPDCVQRWPGATNGGYDPRCCRYPKSCSVQEVEPDAD